MDLVDSSWRHNMFTSEFCKYKTFQKHSRAMKWACPEIGNDVISSTCSTLREVLVLFWWRSSPWHLVSFLSGLFYGHNHQFTQFFASFSYLWECRELVQRLWANPFVAGCKKSLCYISSCRLHLSSCFVTSCFILQLWRFCLLVLYFVNVKWSCSVVHFNISGWRL